MTRHDPEWRRCRSGCCKTGMGVCYRKYSCTCHEAEPVVIAWTDSIEEDGGYTDW